MFNIRSIAYILTGILLMQLFSVGETTESMTRIVGGTTTTIANSPYLVQVRHKGIFICGGALVSQRFVVTAAHCCIGVKPGELIIVGGATKLTDSGVRRSVSKIMRPLTFSMKNLNKDAAVFKLSAPMTGANIRPIALNTSPLTTSMSLKVSGWGLTSENAASVSQQVRTVTVPILGKAKCAQQYSKQLSLTGTMVCASSPGKDACTGDSGGPAVCNGKLCGIVSFGEGCARSNYPGIYTSVRSVIKFIKKSMQQ